MGDTHFSSVNPAGSSLTSYLCAGAGRIFFTSFSTSVEYSAACTVSARSNSCCRFFSLGLELYVSPHPEARGRYMLWGLDQLFGFGIALGGFFDVLIAKYVTVPFVEALPLVS